MGSIGRVQGIGHAQAVSGADVIMGSSVLMGCGDMWWYLVLVAGCKRAQ